MYDLSSFRLSILSSSHIPGLLAHFLQFFCSSATGGKKKTKTEVSALFKKKKKKANQKVTVDSVYANLEHFDRIR